MHYLLHQKQTPLHSPTAGPLPMEEQHIPCCRKHQAPRISSNKLRTETQPPHYRNSAVFTAPPVITPCLQLKQKGVLQPLVVVQSRQKSKLPCCSRRKELQELPLPQRALPAPRAGGRKRLERGQSTAQRSSMETEVCNSAAQCAGSCQKPKCTICQINIPIFNISFKGKH